jgi:hypothetical protein
MGTFKTINEEDEQPAREMLKDTRDANDAADAFDHPDDFSFNDDDNQPSDSDEEDKKDRICKAFLESGQVSEELRRDYVSSWILELIQID